MKQTHFVENREQDWNELRSVLDAYESKRSKARDIEVDGFIRLYRDIARDLAIARSRNYSNALVDRLNDLTVRGHNAVYQNRSGWVAKCVEFVTRNFPEEVRRNWRLLLIATCAFLVPAAGIASLILVDNQYVQSVLSPNQIAEVEEMYDPDGFVQSENRPVRSRLGAFGFYIYNNASIGLRCAATGIFFGMGTVAVLVINGVILSTIFTHLVLIGYSETLFSFVAGHSALELTAIAISGTAGLRLGQAMLAPGSVARSTAIRRARKTAVILVFGAMIMFFFAAFIEAFWSTMRLPPTLKYGVGIGFWILVVGYFVLAGRNAVRQGSN